MSERKYRQRGYQDDDRDRERKPQPARPAPEPGAPAATRRISQVEPRNINMPGFRTVLRCAQCGAVIGLHPQDEEWLSGHRMAGVWFKTRDDASAHQHAMDCVPYGRYRAMAVSPLTSGRLDPPDICLIYGTPGQMIFFVNGLQWSGYKKLSFTSVGESACADSWGKALKTGEPALTIPCYAERRYGGVADDELLMAIPPRFLPKVLDGLAALSRNGLRYPIPPYGIQADAAAGLAVSYADKDKKA